MLTTFQEDKETHNDYALWEHARTAPHAIASVKNRAT